MAQITSVCVLLLLAKSAAGEECAIDRRTPENLWEKKLHKDLRECQDVNPPIQNGSNAVTVTVSYLLKSFKFDRDEETLIANSWLILNWIDDRLKWDPAKYDNIKKTYVEGYYIWVPGVKVLNSAQTEFEYYSYGESEYYFSYCEVEFNGAVTCMPRAAMVAVCNTELRNWPYDTQTCVLELGEYDDYFGKDKRINYTFFPDHPVTLFPAEYGANWDIIDRSFKENHTAREQLTITMVLERHSGGMSCTIVVPSITLAALTLVSLVLDLGENSRMGLLFLSTLGHFMFIQEISESIPKRGADVPLILLFVRSSLMVTVLLLVLTYVMLHCSLKSVSPPVWMLTVNDFIFKSKLKFFVYPRWEIQYVGAISEAVQESKRFREIWLDFVNAVNSALLIVFVIVYAILLSVLVPKPLPSTY